MGFRVWGLAAGVSQNRRHPPPPLCRSSYSEAPGMISLFFFFLGGGGGGGAGMYVPHTWGFTKIRVPKCRPQIVGFP